MYASQPRLGPIAATRQRGVVLVIALIFLLLLTLLALSSSSSSLLQEKMVGGTRNMQLANFGAESALRAAEARLWKARPMGKTAFVNCATSGSPSCYKFDPDTPIANVVDFRTKPGWITAGAQTLDLPAVPSSSNAALAQDPVYIIEDLGLERPPGAGPLHESGTTANGGGATGFENHLYRITARSVGGNDHVVRVLQSTFAAKAD